MIFWIFKEPGSNVLLRQMHGVLSSSETVKLDSDWKRRRRIFGNVSWFFLNEWRIALDNYAAKHDNLFNFICIQRTRISFMLRDQLSFTVCNWFKKIFYFLSPKEKKKKRDNNPNSLTWNLTSLIWVLSVPYLSEQTREFYIFTWQASVFVRTPVSKSIIKEVPWNQRKYS